MSPWYFIWYKKWSSCWTWVTVMAHLSRVKTGSLWDWGQDHANSDSESFLELFLYRPHLQWGCFQTWLQTACSWRLLLASVRFCNADKTLLSISAQGKDLSEGLCHLLPNIRWLEKGLLVVCASLCVICLGTNMVFWHRRCSRATLHPNINDWHGAGVCSCILFCGRGGEICCFFWLYQLMKGAWTG